ncbi:5057_t:CDS:2 [Cetraspora pellucida]|uniref:5057_t:CDS:1 n=1 Tax=Cetraspora pellucida TaxID=1433469 RepID=A0A9N9AFJ6_9GLOM|nr:5057_t:CDS:2 [Cetraspora pellucida]
MSCEAPLNRDIGERGWDCFSFIEISGGPTNPVLKHVKKDTEKLIKEATFCLIDKSVELTKSISTYMCELIRQNNEPKILTLSNSNENVPKSTRMVMVSNKIAAWKNIEIAEEE